MSNEDTGYQRAPNDAPEEKKGPETLNIQQINNAKIQIGALHPLSRIPLLKALPYLSYFKCCLKKPKKDFRLALKKALLRKMDLKMPKTDIQLENDPFLRLGFGMGAYFDTLKMLTMAMLFICCVTLPNMFIFSSGTGIYSESYGFITQFSLGNMGGAEPLCKQFPMLSNSLHLECTSGVIDTWTNATQVNGTTQQPEVGIISSTSTTINYCQYNSSVPEMEVCSKFLNKNAFVDLIRQKCEGKSECDITLDPSVILNNNTLAANYSECIATHYSIYFVQVGCHFSDTEINGRQVQGLYIGCVSVFIALFFVVFIDYINSVFKNAFIEWDVKTITAGDYSCELDIPREMWDTFLKDKYDVMSGKTKIAAFRDFLKTELEERITRLPDLGYEDPAPERIEIAMVTFAFDNSELINLLRVRGNWIKFEKYDKMREVNKQIEQLKSDPNKLQQFNRPVTAFLTFDNEEGINRAKQYNEVVYSKHDDGSWSYPEFVDIQTLLGCELEFEDAAEPTDIIWENRHFTRLDRFKRTIVVVCCVFLLLLGSFCLIYACSSISSRSSLKYPTTDCDSLQADYGSSDIFKEFAFKDYFANRDLSDNSSTPAEVDDYEYTSILKCFCTAASSAGYSSSYEYNNTLTNMGVYGQKYAICSDYFYDYYYALVFSSTMSVAIVVTNSILRIIMIKLIKYIGEDTHSAQLKSITNGVFAAQFFNTGFLMLLSYSNFEEVGLPLASLFDGPFYDFTSDWYTTVGYKLTQTMLINAFMPCVEFVIAYSMAWFFRRRDRGGSKDTYKTKKTSIQLYINLYSGPEYFIHFKYSGVLNVAFVTMMYGLGLPILFPVAAFTYWLLYTQERILVAYFYQLPPTFDDKMTKNAVRILRWAAVIHLFFGYWMLSNKQMFQNIYTFISTSTSYMYTGHTFSTITVDQASPVLMMGMAIFIIIFMQHFFKKILKKWGFSFGGSKINVDENLPFFFTALKLSDADWLLKENENLKNTYGFEIISQETADILDTVKPPKKAIQGVPYYIILANPTYYRDFQYIPCDVTDRTNLIKSDEVDEKYDCEQSDIVSILLNLAFLPEYVVERFHFQTGFSEGFIQSMMQQKIGSSILQKIAGQTGNGLKFTQ